MSMLPSFQEALALCLKVARNEEVPLEDRRRLAVYFSVISNRTKNSLTKALERHLTKSNRSGCVALRKARSTGLMVGLYRSVEQGIEESPDLPWSTVCEDHGGVVCHPTRATAESAMSCPEDWCPVCGGHETPDPLLSERTEPTP